MAARQVLVVLLLSTCQPGFTITSATSGSTSSTSGRQQRTRTSQTPQAIVDDSHCPTGCQCLTGPKVTTCRFSQLTVVPPAPASTADTLDLDHNLITVIRNASFATVSTVRLISLQHNGISRIEAGAFRGLADLTEVRLATNALTSLPDHLFETNRRLLTVDLRDNAFTFPPHGAFYHVPSLHHLYLNRNRLATATLGPGFRSTTQLHTLDLSDNNMALIELDAFAVTTQWDPSVDRSLNLSRCNILYIHRGAFKSLPRLRGISLSGNDELSSTDLVQALQDLDVSNLQEADLSDMNISDTVLPALFRKEEFRALQRLSLSANIINTIPNAAFYFLVNLKYLDLSYNRLSQTGDLGALSKLEQLSLAHNRLGELSDTAFEGLLALRTLDISNNQLEHLSVEPLQNLFELETLDARFNQIASIDVVSGLENLKYLLLANNEITDDFTLPRRLPSLRHLDVSKNRLLALTSEIFTEDQKINIANFSGNQIRSIASNVFGGVTMMRLDLSHNNIEHIQDVRWPSKLFALDLSSNQLTNLSAKSLVGLHHLDELNAANNQLTSIARDMARYTPNLRELDLSSNSLGKYLEQAHQSPFTLMHNLQHLILRHNSLRTLSANIFYSSAVSSPLAKQRSLQLQRLDISYNLIQTLPIDTFHQQLQLQHVDISRNSLRLIDPAIFSPLPSLRFLDMSHNPLACTCDLVTFQKWILSPQTADKLTIAGLRRSGAYVCDSPVALRGTSLLVWGENSDSCDSLPLPLVIIVSGACLVVLLVALCVGLLCHVMCTRRRRQRKEEKTKYYTIRESPTCTVHQNMGSKMWL